LKRAAVDPFITSGVVRNTFKLTLPLDSSYPAMFAMLMKGQTTSSKYSEPLLPFRAKTTKKPIFSGTTSHTSASMEQNKYIIEIVRLIKPIVDSAVGGGLLPTPHHVQQHRNDTIKITPMTNRRRFTSELEKALEILFASNV
jgi:hypothetical protein